MKNRRVTGTCLGILVALAIGFTGAVGEESKADSLGFHALIGRIGSDQFQERNAAEKELIETLRDIDSSLWTLLKTDRARVLDDSCAERLTKAREFYSVMSKARHSSPDPEVRHRLSELLGSAEFSRKFFDLSRAEQGLVVPPFESSVLPGGEEITQNTYSIRDYRVMDLGNIRIIRQGLDLGGMTSSGHFRIRGKDGGGTRSGSAHGSFRIEAKAGKVTFELVDRVQSDRSTFTIEEGVITIGERMIRFGDIPQVVHVSQENEVKSVVRLIPEVSPKNTGEQDEARKSR